MPNPAPIRPQAAPPSGPEATWSFAEGPIEGVVSRPLAVHRDGRGWLSELYRSDALPDGHAPAMAYVSESQPGAVRGPHAHADQADLFAFPGLGAFRVWLWDDREASPTFRHRMVLDVGPGNPAMLRVPPGVVHATRCTSEGPGLFFNAPDRLYRGSGGHDPVDEIRHEDDPESPFVLDMGLG